MVRRLLPFLLLIATAAGLRAEQCVVIGDSLTKEYEAEFPALFPNNPAAWNARNWIEILHQRRNSWFDIGRWSTYADPRLTGHEHNWAFPGATTSEIKSQLNSIANFWWISEFKGQLKDAAERVVVFAGGNDVDSYYGNIYNGASPANYINATRDNLEWIVDYVRSQKSTLPIVLVAVPHLGCSPDVQVQCPTDPVKTARVTAALDSLNSQLAAFAQSRGIGFAGGVYDLTKRMIDEPFRIGGIDFYKQGDLDARPRYVFSGDNFHPNTCAQARIAQVIIDAFRAKYPGTNITPLGDREIVVNILGLDPNIPFNQWIATQEAPAGQTGLYADPDGDGLSNILEFALNGAAPAAPALDQGSLRWSYKPNPVAAEWASAFKPQYSANLRDWLDIPPANIATGTDGTSTVQMPASSGLFYRLLVAP